MGTLVHWHNDRSMLGEIVRYREDNRCDVVWCGQWGRNGRAIDRTFLTEIDLPDDYQPTHIKPWLMPRDYFGECWPGWYSSGFGRSRDSDCREESNFWYVVRALGGESEDVRIVRESHWAVGWVEWIAMHATPQLWIADVLNERYANYPYLDEEDCIRREMEQADEI